MRSDNKGRVPIYELLLGIDRVKDVIADGERIFSLRDDLRRSHDVGMMDYDGSLMQRVNKGEVSREVGLAECRDKDDFELKLKGLDEEGSEVAWEAFDRRGQKTISLEDEKDTVEIDRFDR